MMLHTPKKMTFVTAVGFYALNVVVILIGLMLSPIVLLLELWTPEHEETDEPCRHIEEDEEYENRS